MTAPLPREGSLLESPFARLLFDLWRAGTTGRLCLRNGGAEKTLHLENGDIVVEREGLSEKDFLAALVKKNFLTAEQAKTCVRAAKAGDVSPFRALGDLGLISPQALWSLLESFYARRIFPLFDWEAGVWALDTEAGLPVRERLGLLPAQELILQGVRQMRCLAVMDRFLPDETVPIRVFAPAHLNRIVWEPHERYALQVIGCVANLKAFGEACEIGRLEARKILFAFFALGVAGPAEGEPRRPRGEDSADGNGRAVENLNEKCAFLYRFVTKEIGPLGRTIVARSIEEVRPGLGPLFQKASLLPDGRIEADPALKPGSPHIPEELRKALLRGYEEILMAEVLAVRKALGARHESALVLALEKVGAP
ncbi:MAG: hypothetical protein NTZ26_11000 [Candidatus Aminicenantes bacterium]|nr:hypothetical protein [Candidatus Aminicenantes bacterium]